MFFEPSTPQILADEHLAEHDQAALFMGCGLGKTATVLHRLDKMFDDGACSGALIVAPMRVCNLTWPAELQKWDQVRHLRLANLRTKRGLDAFERGAAELYVCNYEMLPKLREVIRGRKRRPLPFDTVIWDELSRAKNHNSMRINCIRKRLHHATHGCRRHWGMTGTPAPNGLMDLFAQVRLLDGGRRLGPQFEAFRDAYFTSSDWNGYNWMPVEGAREKIYNQIGDLALTLRSSDWLDIPDVVEEDVEVTLPEEARKTYKTMEKELLVLMDSVYITAVNAAVLVGKLLQITSGAVFSEAVESRKVTVHIHDAKLLALGALLQRIGREPVILFYQYTHELERIQRAFPQVVAWAEAGTKAKQELLVAQWDAGLIPVLAAHPKSMAHGLNLQAGGSTIIWFTPTWSREDYDQANSRVARRGQDAITRIYRLLTRDTTDETVAEALRARDAEQSALLEALKLWRQMRQEGGNLL